MILIFLGEKFLLLLTGGIPKPGRTFILLFRFYQILKYKIRIVMTQLSGPDHYFVRFTKLLKQIININLFDYFKAE